MTKHTPGPWECRPSNEYGWTYEITNKEGNDDTQAEANARLIAAAPDLLEALQSVHQWMDDQADAQSKGGHATFDLMMLREQRDKARAAIARATHKEQT